MYILSITLESGGSNVLGLQIKEDLLNQCLNNMSD